MLPHTDQARNQKFTVPTTRPARNHPTKRVMLVFQRKGKDAENHRLLTKRVMFFCFSKGKDAGNHRLTAARPRHHSWFRYPAQGQMRIGSERITVHVATRMLICTSPLTRGSNSIDLGPSNNRRCRAGHNNPGTACQPRGSRLSWGLQIT